MGGGTNNHVMLFGVAIVQHKTLAAENLGGFLSKNILVEKRWQIRCFTQPADLILVGR